MPRFRALRHALCLLPALFATAASAAGGSFFEEFDRFSRARWYVSDGWANGEWQNCLWSSRAVTVDEGVLRLAFLPAGSGERDYLCGEIQTRESFGHGTYEARLRTGRGSGLNAAFFTYIGPQQGQPHDEIDVEILLKDTGSASLNTYVSGTPQNGGTAPRRPSDQGFNTYGFVWEPDRLRWFVNGRMVHEAPSPADLPKAPQRIFLSLWGSDTFTDWMGPFAAPPGPVAMEVDWVAFTRSGEPCLFPGSLACGAS